MDAIDSSDGARDETRAEQRTRLLSDIPASYRPWAHLTMTVGSGLAVLAVAIARVHQPTLLELLWIPLVLVGANAGEWRAHKTLLHRRMPFAKVLYDRHTPMHHMVFRYDDMALRSWRELHAVLIPPFGVFAIVVGTAPLAWVVSQNVSSNSGWLLLVSAALYVVLYEISHLSYHLPPESFIGRLALVRVLREHHRKHHDPRLMQKWNFNVTVPLFDWIHGTIAPRELVEKTVATPSPTNIALRRRSSAVPQGGG